MTEDVLASPRRHGQNTPFKVFTYLASGKPLVATRIPTHTQLLDDSLARRHAQLPCMILNIPGGGVQHLPNTVEVGFSGHCSPRRGSCAGECR